MRLREDDIPLAHIAMCVEGAAWDNPDNIALMVANTALGSWDRTYGGASSLLNQMAQRVLEQDLCHSFQAFNTCYKDTGLWYVCPNRKTKYSF